VNARGLVDEIDILKQYVYNMKIYIVGIVEHFLNKDFMLTEMSIDGYTIYRKD